MVSNALRSLIFSFVIIVILILVITYFRTPPQSELIEDGEQVQIEDDDEVATAGGNHVKEEREVAINLSRNNGTSSEPQISCSR